jgi:hypothetical protein
LRVFIALHCGFIRPPSSSSANKKSVIPWGLSLAHAVGTTCCNACS